MKILVIDDAPEIVEVVTICLQLRWAHAQVISASAGHRGIEMALSDEPELVLLDINLPDIDGYQVLEKIRRFSQVPVVLLTVKSKDTDIAQGFELGADDYVVKPFSNIELVARVDNALRRARQRQTGQS